MIAHLIHAYVFTAVRTQRNNDIRAKARLLDSGLVLATYGLSMSTIGAAALLHSKVFRFNAATVAFLTFLSVQSRTVEYFLCSQKPEANSGDAYNHKSVIFEHQNTFLATLWTEMLDTFLFNVRNRIVATNVSLPSIKIVVWTIANIACVDFLIFIAYEVIPTMISFQCSCHFFLHACLAGLAVFCQIESIYCIMSSIMVLRGSSLPISLRHRHPLLSTSLREFWSVRWNPVVSAQLRNAFYRPVKWMGGSNSLCSFAVFFGSALLHAVPLIIADHGNLRSAGNMAMFFLVHGGVLILERFVAWLGLFYHIGGPAKLILNPNDEWHIEVTICTAILVIIFVVVYFRCNETSSNISDLQLIIMTACSVTTVMWMVCTTWNPTIHWLSVVRWLITISIVFATLPLFSYPLLSAYDECYTSSLLLGKLWAFE